VKFGDSRLPPRFWDKVSPEPNTGCWLWTAHLTGSGYGEIQVGTSKRRRNQVAHRFAYERLVGPIPPGLQCDHICRTRCCVNPAHVEPVTCAENIRRGDTGKRNRDKTHCAKGHAFDAANTALTRRGTRYCKTCNRLNANRIWHAWGSQRRRDRRRTQP